MKDFNPSHLSRVGSTLRRNTFTNNKDNSISRRDFLKKFGIGMGVVLGVGTTGLGLEKIINLKEEKLEQQKIEQEERKKTFDVFLDNSKPVGIIHENKKINPTLEKKEFTYVQVCATKNPVNASIEYAKYHKMGLDVDILPLFKNGINLNRVMINCYDNKNFLSWFIGESRLNKGDYFTLTRQVDFPVYSEEQKIELIKQDSKKKGLDKNLLLAIRTAESSKGKELFGFKFEYNQKKARHETKVDEYGYIDQITAIGEFQINPKYHKGEIRDLIHFENNLDAAIDYLVVLKKRYNNNLNMMLSEWNAGTNRLRWKSNETLNFIKKVKNNYSQLNS